MGRSCNGTQDSNRELGLFRGENSLHPESLFELVQVGLIQKAWRAPGPSILLTRSAVTETEEQEERPTPEHSREGSKTRFGVF